MPTEAKKVKRYDLGLGHGWARMQEADHGRFVETADYDALVEVLSTIIDAGSHLAQRELAYCPGGG